MSEDEAKAAEDVPPHMIHVRRLESEVSLLHTCGIAEIAARNPNVAEYMAHWERRAEAAEADAARLRETLKPFAAAVFNDNGDVTISNVDTPHWVKARRVYLDQALAPPPATAVEARAEAGPSEEALEAAGIVERWIGKEFDSDESCDLLLAFARALDRLAGRT